MNTGKDSCGKLWGKVVEQLWLDYTFIHNFFARGAFLLWTSCEPRATIQAVRKSTGVPRPGFSAPARLEGRYQASEARGGHQGREGFFPKRQGSVPVALRLGAFRGAAHDAGTAGHALATAASDRGRARESSEDSGAACGGSDCDRVSDSTVCRRGGSPPRRRAERQRRYAVEQALDVVFSDMAARAWGQVATLPLSAGCLPVPGGPGAGFAARRVCSMRGRHPLASARYGGLSLPTLCVGPGPGLFGTVLRPAVTSWPERAFPRPAASSPGCLPVVGEGKRPLLRP